MCDTLNLTDSSSSVRVCELDCNGDSLGVSLSRSKWDPYPWVNAVADNSEAHKAGIRVGDCLLEINGEDLLGLKIADIADKLKSVKEATSLVIWNPGSDPDCNTQTLCCGPMPTNLRRLTSFLSNILSSLECPICLEMIVPPAHQCVNGHLICITCRIRTEQCPVCRIKLFRGRSILADQIFTSLIEAFDLNQVEDNQRSKILMEKVFGPDGNRRKKRTAVKVTNKFLTRIMGSGKSSSVENLSQPNNFLSPTTGLKTKSLSSSELSIDETRKSLRPSRSVSSCNGSTTDLSDRINDFDVRFTEVSTQTD